MKKKLLTQILKNLKIIFKNIMLIHTFNIRDIIFYI